MCHAPLGHCICPRWVLYTYRPPASPHFVVDGPRHQEQPIYGRLARTLMQVMAVSSGLFYSQTSFASRGQPSPMAAHHGAQRGRAAARSRAPPPPGGGAARAGARGARLRQCGAREQVRRQPRAPPRARAPRCGARGGGGGLCITTASGAPKQDPSLADSRTWRFQTITALSGMSTPPYTG